MDEEAICSRIERDLRARIHDGAALSLPYPAMLHQEMPQEPAQRSRWVGSGRILAVSGPPHKRGLEMAMSSADATMSAEEGASRSVRCAYALVDAEQLVAAAAGSAWRVGASRRCPMHRRRQPQSRCSRCQRSSTHTTTGAQSAAARSGPRASRWKGGCIIWRLCRRSIPTSPASWRDPICAGRRRRRHDALHACTGVHRLPTEVAGLAGAAHDVGVRGALRFPCATAILWFTARPSRCWRGCPRRRARRSSGGCCGRHCRRGSSSPCRRCRRRCRAEVRCPVWP